MIQTLISVALGGAIGACLRYLVNVASVRVFGLVFPYGTMAVNVLGSVLMGVLVIVLAHKTDGRFTPFLLTGVLGGFTTFSAFSLDALTLWERGQPGLAAAYVFGSVILSLTGIVAGIALGRGFVA